MRLAAIVTSIIALGFYGALMVCDPSYALFAPKGGVVTLSVALLFANSLVWLSGQRHRPLNQRFQYAVAGWIWLLVQVGGLLYELSIASPAAAA